MLCVNRQNPTWLLGLASNWKALNNHMNWGHLPPLFVREAGRGLLTLTAGKYSSGKCWSTVNSFGEKQPEGGGEGLERSREREGGLWHSATLASEPGSLQHLSNAQPERGRSLFERVSFVYPLGSAFHSRCSSPQSGTGLQVFIGVDSNSQMLFTGKLKTAFKINNRWL